MAVVSFCKVENRNNEVQAVWNLYHLAVFKIRHSLGIVDNVKMGKISKAKSYLALCKYTPKTQISEVTINPWGLIDMSVTKNHRDSFDFTMHTAAHEVCHALINKQYFIQGRGLTVNPHGSEWKNAMKKLGIMNPGTKVAKELPMRLELRFLDDAYDMFNIWREGDSWDTELVKSVLNG